MSEHLRRSTALQPSLPDGYMRDARGCLIPESLVRPIDKLRDQHVREVVQRALTMQKALSEFRAQAFADANAFLSLSADQYGVQLGGKKGNVTLHSFDGEFKMQIANADNIVFDERLQAARALIDECIAEWSEGSNPNIRVLVQQAFDTDREGNVSPGRILGLRRLDITDEKWQRAMQAIGESVQVVGTKSYIRFYQRRPGADDYMPISLDIASL